MKILSRQAFYIRSHLRHRILIFLTVSNPLQTGETVSGRSPSPKSSLRGCGDFFPTTMVAQPGR